MAQIDPKRVHLIERDGLHLLFCKDTLEYYQIPLEAADEARSVIVEHQKFIDPDSVDHIREKCQRSLKILQLNVAEDCNLRCEYCIADGGKYWREARAMKPETALRALDLLFAHYEEINAIQFFGGEPLLNLETIRTVAEYIERWKEENPEKSAPYLNINTNGTILNGEIAQIIKDYSIKVVVSIDGPAVIHDTYRKNRAGEGTFDKIMENIRVLYEETGTPDAYELVWGSHYLEEGWSLRQTLEHLEELVPTDHHIWYAAPMLSTDQVAPHLHQYRGFQVGLIDSHLEMIRAGFADLLEGRKPIFDSHAQKLIRCIMGKKSNKYICGPCLTKLMVDASGKLYPCNALIDKSDYLIGDVGELGQEDLAHNLGRYQELFISKRKTIHYEKCVNCWAFNLCTFCLAHTFEGVKPEMDRIPEEICKTQRALAEEVLVQIGKLAQRSEDWEKFLEYVKSI